MGCRNHKGELICDIKKLRKSVLEDQDYLGRDRAVFCIFRIEELERDNEVLRGEVNYKTDIARMAEEGADAYREVYEEVIDLREKLDQNSRENQIRSLAERMAISSLANSGFKYPHSEFFIKVATDIVDSDI